MATLAAMAVGQHWQYAFLFGILPSLLVVWVLARVREPEKWEEAAKDAEKSTVDRARMGSFRELLDLRRGIDGRCSAFCWLRLVWERIGPWWSAGKI